ncbi:MAG TPA: 2,3-epoxybenzoyl-CoA dihydrolase [Micromonosporaceae bacterium]|nr:2,3-epoxybenzoyl-CoA dihydrolase [Micromonosporaceae bacterium]
MASDSRAVAPAVSFQVDPSAYRHWRVTYDGPVATVTMDVAEDGGIRNGYELKLNSYDLGVDIELADIVARLRFEHPEVRAVVLTSAKEKVFSAGANIRMLATADHAWKVNFCKFTNETRIAIEDAAAERGQTWIAACGGTASGGGYELALACQRIMLVDDRSAAVSMPELPLLGVLPATGGLTRLVDKRHVRRDLADVFATKSEGIGGKTAVEWRLVDEAVPRVRFAETVAERAVEAAAALVATAPRPNDARGVVLTPIECAMSANGVDYRYVTVAIDRDVRAATITVRGPEAAPPDSMDDVDASTWPLAMARDLDDAICHLRCNELEVGTWLLRTDGDAGRVLAFDAFLLANADHWLAREVVALLKRAFKRLDMTSRSLVALVEPGSCFAGSLLELALAADRTYQLDGVFDADQQPAVLTVGAMNLGPLPMANGLSRLATRFVHDPPAFARVESRVGDALLAAEAAALGLVTFAPDDIDWDDEVRLAVEERASFNPDALTGMEANYRFVGPETLETKIFARLTAWQNWIFMRPNAAGPDGALRRYGTGQRPSFDRRRV